jgi:hypothetical protein
VKITVDKIDDGWAHSISKQDVRAIFASVPEEWRKGVAHVRLANGLGSPLRAWLAGGEMTIHSRGLSKRVVVAEILIQLAKNALEMRRGLGRLTKADRVKLTAMIQPVLPAVWNEIGRSKPPSRIVEMKLNES